jgi:tRNA1(Val) A37 N6-methylase TrmN6
VGDANAYLWLIAVQDEVTNNNNNEKLIVVEKRDRQAHLGVRAVLRYVRPGAYRVETVGENLKATAYKNKNSSLIAVIMNPEYEATRAVEARELQARQSHRGQLPDKDHDIEEIKVWLQDDGSLSVVLTSRGLIAFKATHVR